MTAPADLLATLRSIVGRRHVLTSPAATRRYRQGYRYGDGAAQAVVRPGGLVEQWRVLQACVDADVIVILQAANTGLTGGSSPDGDDYDRNVVIVSTRRLTGIHLIQDGRQVICLPGATLYDLERALKPLGREPHSVIGSSCIGASVVGGICNNSGGALVQRGPAYTELALYARLDEDGRLRLVNHLGVSLGEKPEAMLARLEAGRFTPREVLPSGERRASDPDYVRHVRDLDAATPARFNADPRRLYEASGSAGRLALFAVRLDTFPKAAGAQVFYIGANDPAELTAIRRDILGRFEHLPIAGEYMHRDAFDIADVYGKDTVIAIERLGTERLPLLFALKARIEATATRLGLKPGVSDRLLQAASRLFPDHLPKRLRDYRDRFEHHLLLKVSAEGATEAADYLAGRPANSGWGVFDCTPAEGDKAFLHRFAAAGAAVRYAAVHGGTIGGLSALDIALPRNTEAWVERLPADVDAQVLHKLYYGHFLCHVFHQDYILAPGADVIALEHEMWDLLDSRGAEYPAEHNVGHLYKAKVAQADFFRELDPCNAFNPGIGQSSKRRGWADRPPRPSLETPRTPAAARGHRARSRARRCSRDPAR